MPVTASSLPLSSYFYTQSCMYCSLLFVSTKQIPIQAGSLPHTCFLLQPHTCHSCKPSLWNPSFFATFSHSLSAPFHTVSLLPFLGLIHMLFTVRYFLSTYVVWSLDCESNNSTFQLTFFLAVKWLFLTWKEDFSQHIGCTWGKGSISRKLQQWSCVAWCELHPALED